MKIRRLVTRLKMCATVLVAVSLLGVIGLFSYLHTVGLPDTAKAMVIAELEQKGVFLQFSKLTYKLNQGLVAEELKVYSDEAKSSTLFSAKGLKVNVDKTKLLRGILEIDSATLLEGKASVPIAPDIPDAPTINIEGLGGEFSISKIKELESAKGLSFFFEGIKITLKGRASYSQTEEKEPPTLAEQKKTVKIFESIREHLRELSWSSSTAPSIVLSVNGDISELKRLKLNFAIQSEDLSFRGASVRKLKVEGLLNRQLVRITNFAFSDDRGDFSAQADLSLAVQEGTFSLESSVNFKDLIQKIAIPDFAEDISFRGETYLKASGTLRLPVLEDSSRQGISLKLMGKTRLSNLSYLDAQLDFVGAEFSWKDNSLFLNNLQAFHADSEFNGRLLMDEHDIRFSCTSSLPPKLFLPFFKGRNMDKTLNQLVMSDTSLCNISAKGTIKRDDITDWNAEGDLYIADIKYRDTIISEASVDFILGHQSATYSNVSVAFDHSNWHKQQAFGGAPVGNVNAAKILAGKDESTGNNLIQIYGLAGHIWPAPVIRLFDMKAYNQFAKFDFQAPLTLSPSDLSFNFKRPEFHTQGQVKIERTNLAGIGLSNTSLDLDLKRGDTTINNVVTTLDYSGYPREQKLAVKTDGKLEIAKVDIQLDIDSDRDQLIILKGIKGKIWPAAAASLFAKKSAKICENLKFTAPVDSRSSNLVFIQNGESWHSLFKLDLASVSYNGVEATNAKGTIKIGDKETLFEDLSLDLDFTETERFAKHGGPRSGSIQVENVRIGPGYAAANNLTGTMWPSQVAALFDENAATALRDLPLSSPLTSQNSHLSLYLEKEPVIQGPLRLANFSYNGIPIRSAVFDFSYDSKSVRFANAKASFDHSNYKVKREFGGPNSTVATAKSVKLDIDSNLVTIDTLAGNFWPGPVIRMFSKDLADEVDEFRFANPPFSSTSGVIDNSARSTKTKLTTSLNAGRFKYHFLDEDVPINSLKTTIHTTSNSVTAGRILAEIFETKVFQDQEKKTIFPLSGNFTLNYNKKVPTYSGDLAFNNISIASLAKTYKFEDLDRGIFSTRLKFNGSLAGAHTLNATDVMTFRIENANLAKIPLLGPFSKIASAIGKSANNEKLGYSEIQNAGGSYQIKKGNIHINSLEAKSSSLSVKGQGTYNLNNSRLDMKFQVSGFKKSIALLEIIRPIIQTFPIIQGVMKYKAYGQLDDLKILPDI